MNELACTQCHSFVAPTDRYCSHCGAQNGFFKNSTFADSPYSPPSPFANNANPAVVAASANFEMGLLGLPCVGAVLILVWVGHMHRIQSPALWLALISFGTVIGTAIIAALEARAIGMKNDRNTGTNGPIIWFFGFLFLWIVAYPMYLYKRKYCGLPNRLWVGLLVAVFFSGSMSLMNAFLSAAQ
jgi:hypothetical protein